MLKAATGSDTFGMSVTIPAGSPRVEPGAVPASPVTLSWKSFTAAADQAGISRQYGGIHFNDGDFEARGIEIRVSSSAAALHSFAVIRVSTTSTLPVSIGVPSFRWLKGGAKPLTGFPDPASFSVTPSSFRDDARAPRFKRIANPADLVVLAGWVGEAGRLAVVTAGAPLGQALVVQVVQERSQDLPGGRQSGIEVTLELFGRLLALRPGDLAEYLVEIVRPHLATLLA